MKKVLVISLIAFFLAKIQAQEKEKSKLDLIQGIWENIYNNENEKSFKIINGIKSLGVSFTNDQTDLDFYLMESIEGFQNLDYDSFDSLNINSFNKNDKYFTTIINIKYIRNGWINKKYCILPDYFECDGENMSINGGQLVEYVRINRLPGTALKLIYNRGKKDNRDYIKEYLQIEVREITSEKSVIYSEPGIPTKMYLIKGDIVTIIREKENWLNIEYLGNKLVKGWIKKSDIR